MNDDLVLQEAEDAMWLLLETVAEQMGVSVEEVRTLTIVGRICAAIYQTNSVDREVLAQAIYNDFEQTVDYEPIYEILDENLPNIVLDGVLANANGLTEFGIEVAQLHIMTFERPVEAKLN